MEVIKPPPHCHIFWSATRARNFIHALAGNSKIRGTYNENIRILNAVYSGLVGKESDPRQFIQHVNPVLFAYEMGMPPALIKRVLAGSWFRLWEQAFYSKCRHCKNIATKMHTTLYV